MEDPSRFGIPQSACVQSKTTVEEMQGGVVKEKIKDCLEWQRCSSSEHIFLTSLLFVGNIDNHSIAVVAEE